MASVQYPPDVKQTVTSQGSAEAMRPSRVKAAMITAMVGDLAEPSSRVFIDSPPEGVDDRRWDMWVARSPLSAGAPHAAPARTSRRLAARPRRPDVPPSAAGPSVRA